jgi:hypothetical protein
MVVDALNLSYMEGIGRKNMGLTSKTGDTLPKN